jgi:two-component system, cell cycle sensor histidine kinase and response regulator CckA
MQPLRPVRVLLVDDDEDEHVIIRGLLDDCRQDAFQLEWVPTFEAGLEALRQRRHELLLVDHHLGGHFGLELLQGPAATEPRPPIIILTGQGDHDLDVAAMKAGAADFLVKGELTPSLLERAIRYALERAHSVEVLKQSEERYRVLFEDNPQPMLVYDRRSLALLTVNRAAIAHYGYSRAEFLTLSLRDLHLPEHLPALELSVNSLPTPERHPGTWKHRRKDGSLIDVEITTHDLNFDARPARLVLAADVTERLRLEEQLRQAQKMESVGQLAAGVAHDFNNLLTVIQGQASLLLSDQQLPPRFEEALTAIQTGAERAANLTRQLLTFSRRQVMQPTLLDLNQLTRNLGGMLRRLLGDDIEVDFHLAPVLPALEADVGMVEQIILNLSVNGRDAMAEGGRLTIRTRVMELTAPATPNGAEVRPGLYVGLEVTDTGCGMDAQTVSHIFEPFFTTKEVGKGTGLGLSTVYGIVKQHQGWIEVASQPGQGTTFRVFFPACRTARSIPSPRPAPAATPQGAEQVLVVEDEPQLRALVRRILENHGYRVLTAANGPEAVEMWQHYAGQIQLMLTDMVMPHGVSGRALGERLLAEDPRLKIIYTSGYSLDFVGKDFELHDGLNFLQKPYHPGKLVELVRHRLDHGESMEPPDCPAVTTACA